jgi:polyisoprenoid-binding protein YceI
MSGTQDVKMDEPEIVRYRIDPSRSRFTVRAFAGGMLSAFAHNPTFAIRGFTGEIEFVPDGIERASLRLQIKADSLELQDDVSAKDQQEIERMMREDVLETSRYPEITFETASVSGAKLGDTQYRLKIVGKLSLHGVTNACTMDAQAWVMPDTLRAQGEFPLRQTDYRIKLVSAAGGTIKVKDELKFSFDIVANKA